MSPHETCRGGICRLSWNHFRVMADGNLQFSELENLMKEGFLFFSVRLKVLYRPWKVILWQKSLEKSHEISLF